MGKLRLTMVRELPLVELTRKAIMEMQLQKSHQERLIKVLHQALEEESKIPYSKKKGEILDILRLTQALQIRFRGSYKTDCKIV